MAWVTEHLLDVWESGDYTGANTPAAVVQVQLGHWVRGWYTQAENPFPRVRAKIWGEGNYGPASAHPGHWSAKWVPTTPFYDVPNLSSIKRTKDLTAKGVTVLEVVLDAQDFVDQTGALGDAYHAIAPGWLAPARNYFADGRPDPHWETNEWAPDGQRGRITDSVKIRVWQGYGAPETSGGNCPPTDGGSNGAWSFAGMIDDVDLDGNPNQITITARNGKLLTDQRVFRASKSVQLKDPVTFYDTLAAEQTSMKGSNAAASSSRSGFPPGNVLDFPRHCFDENAAAYKTRWSSNGNIDDANLEWVEIRLPQGRYDEFWLAADQNLIAYVGIYAKGIRHYVYSSDSGGVGLIPEDIPPMMDGAPIDEGWVDLGHTAPGGGWPYIRSFKTGTTLPGKDTIDRPSLKHTFELGRHSILRVGFTRPTGSPAPVTVGDLHGLHRFVTKEIKKQQFILVDDATEIIKVVLRWAGYQQWDIEDAGVRLSDGTNYGPGVVGKSAGRLAFNRSKYLVDIIDELAAQLGWIFFIADPTDANSEGVPTFRHDSSLLKDPSVIAANLDERTMLTGLKTKDSDESRPSIIRVRGKTASARAGGVPLGGDSVRRIMAVYTPPWAIGSGTGGVLRHIVYQDDQLTTYAMCLYGCFLIAIQAALQMYTVIAQIPAHLMLELDDQVAVLDEPTATNSRLWIVKSTDTMTLGETASWVQTLEGSLLDTKDMRDVIDQVTGRTSFVVGIPQYPFEKTISPPLDWSHVTDPDSGETSGYTSPVIATPKSRTGKRTR